MPRLRSSGRGGLGVALHEEGLVRRRALERALAEEAHHEGADVQADLRPQRLVVRLEHDPLGAAEERLLEEQREAADRDVLPLRAGRRRRRRACARPRRRCRAGRCAGVDAERVQHAVLAVGQLEVEPEDAAQIRLRAGRRLPHAASASIRAIRRRPRRSAPIVRFRPAGVVDDPGVVHGRVLVDHLAEPVDVRRRGGRPSLSSDSSHEVGASTSRNARRSVQ